MLPAEEDQADDKVWNNGYSTLLKFSVGRIHQLQDAKHFEHTIFFVCCKASMRTMALSVGEVYRTVPLCDSQP